MTIVSVYSYFILLKTINLNLKRCESFFPGKRGISFSGAVHIRMGKVGIGLIQCGVYMEIMSSSKRRAKTRMAIDGLCGIAEWIFGGWNAMRIVQGEQKAF